MKKIQYYHKNINIFQIHKLQLQIHQTIFAQNAIVNTINAKKSNIKLKQQNKKNISKI